MRFIAVLNRQVQWPDLHFKTIILAAVLRLNNRGTMATSNSRYSLSKQSRTEIMPARMRVKADELVAVDSV